MVKPQPSKLATRVRFPSPLSFDALQSIVLTDDVLATSSPGDQLSSPPLRCSVVFVNPQLSVVIPVYNNGELLRTTSFRR